MKTTPTLTLAVAFSVLLVSIPTVGGAGTKWIPAIQKKALSNVGSSPKREIRPSGSRAHVKFKAKGIKTTANHPPLSKLLSDQLASKKEGMKTRMRDDLIRLLPDKILREILAAVRKHKTGCSEVVIQCEAEISYDIYLDDRCAQEVAEQSLGDLSGELSFRETQGESFGECTSGADLEQVAEDICTDLGYDWKNEATAGLEDEISHLLEAAGLDPADYDIDIESDMDASYECTRPCEYDN